MVELFAIRKIPEGAFERYREPLLSFLPTESKISINKFRRPDDFQRSLLGESLARIRLSVCTGIPASALQIERSEKGKPRLTGEQAVHFNISHSGDWVVVAVSDQEVGIDVEKIREPHYRIAERFFSPHELQQLNALTGDDRKKYFFDLWTLKESYLKLLGKGLTQSLGSFTMTRTDGKFKIIRKGELDERIHFHQDQLDPNYKLSVCCLTHEKPLPVVRLSINDLVKQINYGNEQ